MAQKDIVICSECIVEHDQEIRSHTYRKFNDSLRFKQRIFDKNGKKFCLDCLVSKYNIDCQFCCKQINSKDELGDFTEARWVDDNFIPADTCSFCCVDCHENKTFKEREKMSEGQGQDNACGINGCSQKKPSYGKYCSQHWDKSCQGTYEGKRCDLSIGNDGGDFCERCKKQNETFQQRRIRLTVENGQEINNQEEINSSNTDKSEILKLPTDEEIKKLTKEEIINLKNQINAELENRKNEISQTSNHIIDSKQLTIKLKELEKILNNLPQTHNTSNDNKVFIGKVLLISAFCLFFVVSALILVKRKFFKNKT